jgi:hypothetical protein
MALSSSIQDDIRSSIEADIYQAIENYSEDEMGWTQPWPACYEQSKFRRDLEAWCFTESQRRVIILPKVYYHARNIATKYAYNRNVNYDKFDWARALFWFYRDYAETIAG